MFILSCLPLTVIEGTPAKGKEHAFAVDSPLPVSLPTSLVLDSNLAARFTVSPIAV